MTLRSLENLKYFEKYIKTNVIFGNKFFIRMNNWKIYKIDLIFKCCGISLRMGIKSSESVFPCVVVSVKILILNVLMVLNVCQNIYFEIVSHIILSHGLI